MGVDSTLPKLIQPAFFDGQRLTAADLTATQEFHRGLRQLHNRSLHAWGIALGLMVTGDREAKEVVVQPGYALDALGRDLVVTEPVTVPVPPVAGLADGSAAGYFLTVSYLDDAEARTVERRSGDCAGEGAVRLEERPLIRWQKLVGPEDEEGGHRPGLDVVLARAVVRNCMLDEPLSLAERRDARPSTLPYVAGGATPVGTTPWSEWRAKDDEQPPDPDSEVIGVKTVVDTSAGRFQSGAPTYLAQLSGFNIYRYPSGGQPGAIFQGFVQTYKPAPGQFEFRVLMPERQFSTQWMLNPRNLLTGTELDTTLEGLRSGLQWHVVWTGVEG
jgi:hypothetical protein